MENVMSFYREVAVNEELRMKLADLFKPYEGKALDETKRASLATEVLLPFAKNAGFEFSMEELLQYEKDIAKKSENGELSTEELEVVSGGLGIAIAFCIILGLGGAVGLGMCWFTGLF